MNRDDAEPGRGVAPRRVLVPVDFSEPSKRAVGWALSSPLTQQAELILLHVVHDPGAAPGYYSQSNPESHHITRLEEAAEVMFREYLESLYVEAIGLDQRSYRTRIVVGLPVARILEVAELEEVDHIVMASLGRTGLPHLLMGSKAERIVRLAPMPVTIVKQWPLEPDS